MLEIKKTEGNHELPPGHLEIDIEVNAESQKSLEETLDIKKLEHWLDEIRNQPRWRLQADKEADYYDGKQIDAETLELMLERGQAPIIDNMIQPTINAVLGMQAKSRLDTVVKPEAGETNTDVAEALSLKMKQESEQSRSDRAKSDAYAEQIKVGIGWLEVSRNKNPFESRYRYDNVHRREIYWDWRARKHDLSDARYLVRRKWMDEDVLISTFPQKKQFIKTALSGRANWDLEMSGLNLMTMGIDHDVSTGFTTSIEQYEWMNTARKRLCMYEVWYRVHTEGYVTKLPNGKVTEYDENNPEMAQLYQDDLIEIHKAVFDKVRVAFWIGPQLVGDYPSPYQHNHFPYIPFFGFREDRTGIPYGLIRTMMSPQDEINARKSKMMWLLSAKRVMATENAVEDHHVAAEEVARPDAYLIVSNKPGESFTVEENGPMAAQQFQVMQEAKESIQTSVGVHNATLGRDSGATSGLAINSLVEQDSITLAEINDNFNMAARHADELLLSLIIEDLSDVPNHPVTVEDDIGKKRDVILNQIASDPETGLPAVVNDITKINVAVVLADAPSTPTFRNQQLYQLTELVKTLPPNIQAMLMPFVIEATDLPKRKEMSELIRQGLGLGDGTEDPEKAAMQQKIQELEQKLAMKNPPELLAAQVDKLRAEIDNIRATSTQNNVKALFEAMQSAGLVVTNPAIVPVADSIAKSAGFVDQDGGNLAQDAGGIQSNSAIPQPNPQTAANSPLAPESVSPQQPDVPSPDLPESPAIGVAHGIETPRND